MNSFLGIFGTPSFEPLLQHMMKTLECVELLKSFFEDSQSGSWENAEMIHKKINMLEDEADRLKEEIRLHLPRSLFMPVERTDVLDILSLQDRIANKAKHISGLISNRKIVFPASTKHKFINLVETAIVACRHLLNINKEIKNLMASGFRAHEAEKIEELIHQLDRIENDTDHIQIELRADLFKIEKDLPAIEVVFLYKVIDWIGELADRAQRCGHRILLLIAR